MNMRSAFRPIPIRQVKRGIFIHPHHLLNYGRTTSNQNMKRIKYKLTSTEQCPRLSILENHHSGSRLFFYIYYQNKAIKNAMYITCWHWQVCCDHSARPSFRNENMFDLCTAALFTGTSNVVMVFLESFCVTVFGFESIAFSSSLLSRNNSSP